jgi:Chaperone of endosialidase
LSNTTGYNNTADGAFALFSNTEGRLNTANGFEALFSNSTGQLNTAIGAKALYYNTSAANNTAIGYAALLGNTMGDSNTAIGSFALNSNDIGDDNIAIGTDALAINTSGAGNVAIGRDALLNSNGSANSAVGFQALVGGGLGNTALGYQAGYDITGLYNICIGYAVNGIADENYTIRIADNLPSGTGESACYMGGIFAQQVGGSGLAVFVDANGKLGMNPSSRRFKRDINRMDKASEAILALKPVTFHYKNDTKNTPSFGLVAEDVEKVDPNLVVRDKEGELISVRYDAVNAMLLNEFLKEHRKVQELQAIAARQQKQIEALTAGLQRVSDRLELSKSAPHTVVRNQ